MSLFVGYLVASFVTFDRGYILNLLYPLLTLPLIYVSSVICQIVIEQSDKRFVKDLFGRYVSPQVAGEILNLADAGKLKLGGEQREVTVLFADIRQFTKMSEQRRIGTINGPPSLTIVHRLFVGIGFSRATGATRAAPASSVAAVGSGGCWPGAKAGTIAPHAANNSTPTSHQPTGRRHHLQAVLMPLSLMRSPALGYKGGWAASRFLAACNRCLASFRKLVFG